MAIAYIAFGSNLDNREENIENALKALSLKGISLLSVSKIIETEPVGYFDQPNFFNGVCKVQTNYTPHQLLDTCLEVEQKLGRVRTFPNAPRIIDLDILLYDNIEIEDNDLIIPHPRMWERYFVIHPLKEIAPDLVRTHYENRKIT